MFRPIMYKGVLTSATSFDFIFLILADKLKLRICTDLEIVSFFVDE